MITITEKIIINLHKNSEICSFSKINETCEIIDFNLFGFKHVIV